MATNLLGNNIDIHGGGADLIFPHHESEIAQAEGATGRQPFVRFWLHAAMVYHDGEKMSKSLGNLVMIRDLLQDWSPDALRLYLAGHHYRTSWSYAEPDLSQAARLAEKLTAAFQAIGGPGPALDAAAAPIAFSQAMDHDLEVSAALPVLDQLAGEILAAAGAGRDVRAAQATLSNLGQVFGLRLGLATPEPRVSAGWTKHLQRFSEQ